MTDAATIGDLLERRVERDEREDEAGDALHASGTPERRYDAARLRTDARKTGNFLRQLGVGSGRTVAIADVRTPESILTLFGAALLGAPTCFVSANGSEADGSDDEVTDARVLVGPVGRLADVSVNASKRVAYGGAPDDPEIAYFERDVWSENPTFPLGGPDGGEMAIETAGRNYTHRELVGATERIVDERGLGSGARIAVRAPLADPRTVVAGVLAPLACGGTVLLPDAGTRGDLAVVADGTNEGPEPKAIDASDVALDEQ